MNLPSVRIIFKHFLDQIDQLSVFFFIAQHIALKNNKLELIKTYFQHNQFEKKENENYS